MLGLFILYPSVSQFVNNNSYGREYTDAAQSFCSVNHHPALTESWETIDRYVSYAAYATFYPIALCTGLILVYRKIRKLFKEAMVAHWGISHQNLSYGVILFFFSKSFTSKTSALLESVIS